MNSFARQRETPTRSPFAKSPNPRSPTKATRQELGLSLQQVIGTTCGSSNCFDVHPGTSSFAYTAGAAGVLATVDADLNVRQRFFRAYASQYTTNRPSSSHTNLQAPSIAADPRSRISNRSSREDSPFATGPQDTTDSPSGKSGHARDRVKAATAISISKNGKWLAVGETGYRPRVLVFPVTDKPSTDAPAAIISEHGFGVHAIAFSPDSKLLATLGTTNDGFLYIWEVDERTGATTLLASNKCTTTVKQIAWIGRNLITVGLRFIKVWRPDDPSPVSSTPGDQTNILSGPSHKPLAGRNTLLNALLDETFISVSPISDTTAVICTEAGHVCLLDDTERQQTLRLATRLEAGISAATSSGSRDVFVALSDGKYRVVSALEIERADTPAPESATSSPKQARAMVANYGIALGLLPTVLVTVDKQRRIQLRSRSHGVDEAASLSTMKTLTAHADPVLGVRSASGMPGLDMSFLTWSAGGIIMGWTQAGQPAWSMAAQLDQVNDMYDIANELKTVSAPFSASLVATGDRYGVLRVFDVGTGHEVTSIRAHASDINHISIYQDATSCFIVSASRDRSLQVFRWRANQFELLQTLDEHAGAVTGVIFGQSKQIISCSADRTIVVRQALEDGGGAVVFAISKTITLKSAPTSMRLSTYENTLLVSTSDRHVQLINFTTGKTTHAFKSSDSEGGDPVILSSLVHLPSATGPPVIAGVSSTDKSIRLYSEDGTLLARDTGHTEGVTDIALINSSASGTETTPNSNLVTAAADGTIFLWDTTAPVRQQTPVPDFGVSTIAAIHPASPVVRPPLRKVISSAEIIRLQRAQSPTHEDAEPTTPSAVKSTHTAFLRKKPSRLNVSQAPRLEARSPSAEPVDGLDRSTRSPSPSRSTQRQSLAPRSPTTRHSAVQSLDGTLDRNNVGSPLRKTHSAAEKHITTEQLCRILQMHRTTLESAENDANSQPLNNLESELQATLDLVKKLRGDMNWEIIQEDSIEDVTQSLGHMDLHQRFEGLRKKSSEVVPGAANQP
ncbi:hypothetical protein MBLNU457_g2643t1 [Dothideomycetes sp. NU457]